MAGLYSYTVPATCMTPSFGWLAIRVVGLKLRGFETNVIWIPSTSSSIPWWLSCDTMGRLSSKMWFSEKMRIHPLHPTTIVLTPLLANSSLRELPNDMSLTESSVCLKPGQFAMCVILCSADWQFQPSNK